MGSAVADQVTSLGEGPLAGEAGEWFFSRVRPLVTIQVTRIKKSLVTLGTGFLFDVYFLVPPHVF